MNTSSLSASSLNDAVTYSYAGDATYAATGATSTLTVDQATPTVSVVNAGGTYDGSPFPATATVAGVDGTPSSSLEGVGLTVNYYAGTFTSVSQLFGVPPLPAPSMAGSYTVLASFPGSTDYANASAMANFRIAEATPTVSVTDPGGSYGRSIPSVSATVAGVSGSAGSTLENVGLTFTYYSGTYASVSALNGATPLAGEPSGAGSYTVEATFAGSTDYTADSAVADFDIARAAPVLAVSDAGGTFDGSTFPVTDSVAGVVAGVDNTPGPELEGVGLTLTFYAGTYANASQLSGLTPLGGSPTGAGPYTVEVSFPGSADYAAGAAVADFSIAQATPTVSVDDAGGTYSGSAFPATASVAGVNGTTGATLESTPPSLTYYSGTYAGAGQLNGHAPLSGAPTHAGAYTVLASFPGTADYASATALANFSIAPATPQVTWNAPASIVFGTPLSATQLDASFSGVAGNAVYTPGVGGILGAGAGQTLSLTFTPTDSVNYMTALATTTITVTPATPTLSVSAPGGAYDGSPYAASVTIAGSTGAAPAASLEDVSPTLTYYAGTGTSGTDLGATPPSSPGTYTVVASFPGSADYTATRSTPVTFAIGAAAPSVTLSLSGGTTAYGQAVTFTATVTGGAVATGGTVTFHDGSTTLGTAAPDASGRATLTTTALAVGAHSITASYSGSSTQPGVTSAAASESVTKAAPQVVLVPQPVFRKKKVIALGLEAEVRPTGAGTPTGTVTFEEMVKTGKGKKARVTEKVLGNAALSGGSATMTVKPRSVLKRPIAIVYGGDADFRSGTSASVTLTPASLKSLARPMPELQGRGAVRCRGRDDRPIGMRSRPGMTAAAPGPGQPDIRRPYRCADVVGQPRGATYGSVVQVAPPAGRQHAT